jgi:hypothetical protein
MEILSGNEMNGIEMSTVGLACYWTCKCPVSGLYDTYYANRDAAIAGL